MKTTILKKTNLSILMCLYSTVILYAQPVIKVPRACEVVLAGTGTGASTGFGGTVGEGGIVVMPDPFDFANEEGNFYYISSDYELIQWELLGDLSMQTDTKYNEVIQPTGAMNPVNIQSYNKNLRFGEMPSADQPNFDVRWARSKGRVIVSYYDRRCVSKIKFDVYKRYKNDKEKSLVPAIIGSDCLVPNTNYTFSVDPIASDNPNDEIGFDNYYWSRLPEGCTLLYNSPDNSSITIKTGERISSFTLQCCYGRANDWDGNNGASHTTCVSKLFGGQLETPTLSTAVPACIPTGTSAFTTTITPVTGYTYVWTATNVAWTLAQSGTQNAVLNITINDNNPTILTLTITNGSCTPTIINYTINRTLATGLGITAVGGGGATTCINAATNYSLPQNAIGNQTNWTIFPVVAGGPTVANGTGTGSTCTVTPGTTVGAFSLIATATTCTTTDTRITINVKPLTPTITAASGSTNCVVKGALTPQTYTCTASTGANYNWTFPAGWTAPGNNFTTSTNTITVTPANNTAVLNGNATVTATGVGTCNSTISANYAINYQAVAPTFAATPATTCFSVGATTASITLTNAQNFGSYTVTSSPAGITSSGVVTSGNLALTIPPSLASGTYSLTVTHTSSCGNPAATTVTNLTLGGSAASWALNYPSYDNTVGGSDVYRVTVPTGGATYQWYTGATVFTTISALTLIPSPGTNPNASFSPSGNQMTLYGATALTNPQVYCVVTPTTGCASIISAPRGTHGTARPTNNGIKNEKIVIYPNPNDGNFSILLDKVKTTATATLTDMTGKKLGTYTLSKGENKISNKNLASGTYMIIIEVDGEKESQQVIIK